MAEHGLIRQSWNRVGLAETSDEATDEVEDGSFATFRDTRDGTFIASGAAFEGTLTLKGDFRIDTEFRGELETDGKITVGPEGTVVGRIHAREIVIAGAVVGDVSAPRQVILESTGKLHGNIETVCLEIQKHAFFKGSTAMTQPQAYRRPETTELAERPSAPAPL